MTSYAEYESRSLQLRDCFETYHDLTHTPRLLIKDHPENDHAHSPALASSDRTTTTPYVISTPQSECDEIARFREWFNRSRSQLFNKLEDPYLHKDLCTTSASTALTLFDRHGLREVCEDSEVDAEEVQARYALAATKRRKASTASASLTSPLLLLPTPSTPTPSTDIPGSPVPVEFDTRTPSFPPVKSESSSQPYDDGLLPPFSWSHSTSTWVWTSPLPLVPSIAIHPSPYDNPTSLVWTPLQIGVCPLTSQHRLPVPGGFTLDNPHPHPACFACSPPASLIFRRLCVERIGEDAEVVVMRDVEVQRAWGLHARCWTGDVGACCCAEWRAFDAMKEEGEGEESGSDEEEPVVRTPSAGTLALPSEEKEPTSPGPRWADLEDEEDLPDLDEWT